MCVGALRRARTGVLHAPEAAARGVPRRPARRINQPTPNGPIAIATVRDPDGLLVLLTPGSVTRR